MLLRRDLNESLSVTADGTAAQRFLVTLIIHCIVYCRNENHQPLSIMTEYEQPMLVI